MAQPLITPRVENRLQHQKRIRKEVLLSSDDWTQVARRMTRVGETNFSRFTRQLLVSGRIVPRMNADEAAVVRQLSWIGNNLNQIAKKANTTDILTRSMAEEVLRQFHDVQTLIMRVYGKAPYGGREGTQHLQDAGQEHQVCDESSEDS